VSPTYFLSRYRGSPDVVAERLGDEIVLVHMTTDRMYALNRTAARVWELLCGGYDRAGIQRRLLQEFEVTETRLSDEIDDLITTLRSERLIALESDGWPIETEPG